jgi:hypothetical protein
VHSPLPEVIKEAQKAIDRDIRPTLDLVSKIIFGVPLPATKRAPEPSKRASPIPRTLAQKNTSSKKRGPAASMPVVRVTSSSVPMGGVADAEIVDEEGPSSDDSARGCPTCGGSGKLGRAGHEIRCPACK